MQSFLSLVVSDILQKRTLPLHQYIIVLPSQRACVFLKNEFKTQLSKSSFLPRILSIENYIQEIADLKQLDTIQLLFEFYTIYQNNTEPKDIEPFDTFSQWATIVLNDFNEIDRHLVDSKKLFTYLSDINRLNNWTPDTNITRNYFSFFDKLHIFYEEFYSYLESKKVGYQGLIYREAENNIQHYIQNNSDKHIGFVGFNALNKSEEHIFQEFLESGISSVYWDAEDTYMNNKKETGMFLRKYKNEWPYYQHHEFNWISNTSNNHNQSIEIIGATKNVGQLKYIGELLEKQNNFNKTALVLADESLLSLTLNSLPKNIEKLNITMGLPLQEIPLFNFFNNVFNLYLNQDKLNLSENNSFYYKDILNIINHPVSSFMSINPGQLNSAIGKANLIFISYNQLLKMMNPVDHHLKLVEILFDKKIEDPDDFIPLFIDLIILIKPTVSGVEKEQLFRFYTVFQQLRTLNDKFGHIKSIKVLHQFFNQLVRNEKLAFQGEPLEGLQLMGMLETRAIDFETIIVSSLNEGILPSSKSDNSFIPFDVKKHFDLPTYQEKDAIFSYHFYHLLHRSKNVFLLYNTEKDVYGTGEKSRFLTQLELTRKNINHSLVSPILKIESEKLQLVPKSKDLYDKLKSLALKGVSPSALASYINNPIDFYYQKILNIKDLDEVEETVALNTMGTVIHETLEQLYKPYINSILTEGVLNRMISNSENLIISNFKKIYLNGNISTGKNKLIFEVSKKFLQRFLQLELQEIKDGKEIKIIALEKQLSASLQIEGLDFPIKIRGIVDRIDMVNNTLRILDYKTGLVKATDLKITNFEIIKDDYKYTKGLQVMLYAYLYLYNHNFDFSNSIEAGIVSFKNLNSGFLKMNFGDGTTISQEKIDDFLISLKEILLELYNKEIPFQENKNKVF